MKYILIPKYDLSDIDEVFLLSAEEWKQAKEIEVVPKYTGRWWLRSPGFYPNRTMFVSSLGLVYENGLDLSEYAVRSAFKIQNLKFKNGDKLFIEDTLCSVIDTDTVLSDSVICSHRFDSRSNDYEKSEIKAFINSDEFKEML